MSSRLGWRASKKLFSLNEMKSTKICDQTHNSLSLIEQQNLNMNSIERRTIIGWSDNRPDNLWRTSGERLAGDFSQKKVFFRIEGFGIVEWTFKRWISEECSKRRKTLFVDRDLMLPTKVCSRWCKHKCKKTVEIVETFFEMPSYQADELLNRLFPFDPLNK